ncbi:hypothetical protein PIB30_042131 [Stylosanthes scabra]|uniref:TIR domain-containing protein n=1 Tax=Stylosanthes scabra TaxID=79078 RepID=A0ABU6XG21_9FABA|nr:hypothetical protein [Stylosanthes scabra]
MALLPFRSSFPNATHHHEYDMFISFRGEDTRNGFTSHLHSTLRKNHIETFIDYRIKKGGAIWDKLVDAVRDSKLFLVIFSENYASSKWCLRELVEIMECKKKKEQHVIVISVFYRIEPTHVRNQTGTYHTAFARHEGSSEDRCHVQQWRTALTQAANLSGLIPLRSSPVKIILFCLDFDFNFDRGVVLTRLVSQSWFAWQISLN